MRYFLYLTILIGLGLIGHSRLALRALFVYVLMNTLHDILRFCSILSIVLPTTKHDFVQPVWTIFRFTKPFISLKIRQYLKHKCSCEKKPKTVHGTSRTIQNGTWYFQNNIKQYMVLPEQFKTVHGTSITIQDSTWCIQNNARQYMVLPEQLA
jgi:hypothetical protein